MGGRGMISASDKRYYANQREAFRKIADQAEKAHQSLANKNIAKTARAAESLVGTERARALVSDQNTKQIKTEMERAYAIVGSGAMGQLDDMLQNETLQNPLGAGYTATEWQGVKDAVQGYYETLTDAGYTHDEIAAALAYGQYLVRGETGRKSSWSLPRSAKAVTVTVNGRETTYFEQNGMLMKSDAIGTTRGTPVKSGGSLAQIYANAKEKGLSVRTHSASEVKAANSAYAETRMRNAREIANAETSGTKQSKKISKQSGRVKATRRR